MSVIEIPQSENGEAVSIEPALVEVPEELMPRIIEVCDTPVTVDIILVTLSTLLSSFFSSPVRIFKKIQSRVEPVLLHLTPLLGFALNILSAVLVVLVLVPVPVPVLVLALFFGNAHH